MTKTRSSKRKSAKTSPASPSKRKRLKKDAPTSTDKKEEATTIDIATGDKSEAATKSDATPTSAAPSSKDETHIVERGTVYFLYRYKIDLPDNDEVDSLDSVARLFILLQPSAESKKNRLIIVFKKHLPDQGERFLSTVAIVSDKLDEHIQLLDEHSYDTKTRGTRHMDRAHQVGEGFYALVMHHKHLHLAYVLKDPPKISDAQSLFGLHKDSSLVMSIKTPQEQLDTPEYHTRWNQDVTLLDHPKTQLLLIGTGMNLIQDFGKFGEDLITEALASPMPKPLFEQQDQTKKDEKPAKSEQESSSLSSSSKEKSTDKKSEQDANAQTKETSSVAQA